MQKQSARQPSIITVLLLAIVSLAGCAAKDFSSLYRPAAALNSALYENNANNPSQAISTFDWGIELSPQIQQLMATGVNTNLNYYIAQQRLIIAQSDYQLSTGQPLPSARLSISSNSAETLTAGINRKHSIALGVAWQVDLWQKMANDIAASKQQLAARDWDLSATKLSFDTQLLDIWLDIVEQHRLSAIYKLSYSNQKHRVDMLSRRVDLGLSDATGLDNARLSMLKLSRDLAQTENRSGQAYRRLNTLLARPPTTELSLPMVLPSLNPLVALPKTLPVLLQRPDVKSAEAELLAAGYRWQKSSQNGYPDLTLDLSYRVRESMTSRLFDGDYWLGTLNTALLKPLFFRDELKLERQQQRARAEIAQAQFYQTLLSAWQDIENYLQSEQSLSIQAQGASDAQQSARRVETNTIAQYQLGLASSFDLLNAQRNSLNAETDLVRLQVQQVRNRINLLLAMGVPPQSPRNDHE